MTIYDGAENVCKHRPESSWRALQESLQPCPFIPGEAGKADMSSIEFRPQQHDPDKRASDQGFLVAKLKQPGSGGVPRSVAGEEHLQGLGEIYDGLPRKLRWPVPRREQADSPLEIGKCREHAQVRWLAEDRQPLQRRRPA